MVDFLFGICKYLFMSPGQNKKYVKRISECGEIAALLGFYVCLFSASAVAIYSCCVFCLGNAVCSQFYWIPVLVVVLSMLFGVFYLCLQRSVLLPPALAALEGDRLRQELGFRLLLLVVRFVSTDLFVEDPPPRFALL